ncbi:MAG: threonylcarbamoyl-AMP synthase [Candidatus Lokiarchaeota archaeon]|nr:threonylcarbamoyl-AMP synthase [Candidatus Lokiarchaeota archaeon]
MFVHSKVVIPVTAEIIVATEENYDDAIEKGVEVLQNGGIVVYPTDTSYGIACDPRNEDAISRLLAIKQRDAGMGVPLLFSDLDQCEKYADMGSLEKVLARLFWPGMLTMVVTPIDSLPSHITGNRTSLAIRIPNHPVPRGLAKGLGAPIVGTSANRTGGPSPFIVDTAREQLGDEVDLYIDCGPSESEKNSTIIGVEDGSIKVYREGQLSISEMSESLKVDSDALKLWTTRIVYADM